MRFVIHFFWAGSLPLAGASNSYVLVTYYLLQTLLVTVPGNSDDQLLACSLVTLWEKSTPSNTGHPFQQLLLCQPALPASGVFLLLQWLVQRVLPSFTENPYACGTGRGSVQLSSVAQLCLTLCNPMNRSTPDLPVHHQLPEFTQTHVHWVGDTIQPSHPLSCPSPPALNLSQHQGLFKWVSSSHQVANVLELQLQHQSFRWTPRTDFL